MRCMVPWLRAHAYACLLRMHRTGSPSGPGKLGVRASGSGCGPVRQMTLLLQLPPALSVPQTAPPDSTQAQGSQEGAGHCPRGHRGGLHCTLSGQAASSTPAAHHLPPLQGAHHTVACVLRDCAAARPGKSAEARTAAGILRAAKPPCDLRAPQSRGPASGGCPWSTEAGDACDQARPSEPGAGAGAAECSLLVATRPRPGRWQTRKHARRTCWWTALCSARATGRRRRVAQAAPGAPRRLRCCSSNTQPRARHNSSSRASNASSSRAAHGSARRRSAAHPGTAATHYVCVLRAVCS